MRLRNWIALSICLSVLATIVGCGGAPETKKATEKMADKMDKMSDGKDKMGDGKDKMGEKK